LKTQLYKLIWIECPADDLVPQRLSEGMKAHDPAFCPQQHAVGHYKVLRGQIFGQLGFGIAMKSDRGTGRGAGPGVFCGAGCPHWPANALETVGGGNSYWRSAQSLPILSQGASTTHPPESQAGGLAPQFACVAA
jgi:hypothetical protein